ncbi:MAG: hypothetical protein R3D80_21700 [Paracoccaceae bacterium]
MTAVLEPLQGSSCPPAARSRRISTTPRRGRRAERCATRAAEAEPGDVNGAAIRYLSRLSDWLFCAARMANDEGRADVLWVPRSQPLTRRGCQRRTGTQIS